MLASETVEETFIPLLQRRIAVVFNNKTVKAGKLLLVTLKNNYITLILSEPSGSSAQMKTYELPYAFDYNYDDDAGSLTLSYEIDKLCNDNSALVDCANKILVKVHKTHRFLGATVSINVVDD